MMERMGWNKTLVTAVAVVLTCVSQVSAQMYSQIGPGPKKEVFNSAKWRHDPSYTGTQAGMLDDLLANHKLVGLTRKELYDLLGIPGVSFHAYAAYDVYVPDTNDLCLCIEFAFRDDRVTRFRSVNRCGAMHINTAETLAKDVKERNDWVDAPAETKKDEVEIALQLRFGGQPKSTVIVPPAPDDALLINALKKSQAKDYEGTSRDYAEFLKLFPNDSRVWDSEGNTCRYGGRYERAIEAYSKSIEIKAEPGSYEGRAECYIKLGKYKDAITDYTTAIDILHPKVKGSQERTYINLGVDDHAARFRTAYAYSHRAVAYWKEHQIQRAFEDIESAIEADQKIGFPYLIRAEFYLSTGKYEKALEDYEKVVAEDKRLRSELAKFTIGSDALWSAPELSKEALMGRAQAYEALRKVDLAKRDRAVAETLQPSPDGWCLELVRR